MDDAIVVATIESVRNPLELSPIGDIEDFTQVLRQVYWIEFN